MCREQDRNEPIRDRKFEAHVSWEVIWICCFFDFILIGLLWRAKWMSQLRTNWVFLIQVNCKVGWNGQLLKNRNVSICSWNTCDVCVIWRLHIQIHCLVLRRLKCGKPKTRLNEPSRSIAQWTMGTFSVDAKDTGMGPMIPSAEPKSKSLSNPLERAWIRGRQIHALFAVGPHQKMN